MNRLEGFVSRITLSMDNRTHLWIIGIIAFIGTTMVIRGVQLGRLSDSKVSALPTIHTCRDFKNRTELANYLKQYPQFMKRMDADGDKIACESVK